MSNIEKIDTKECVFIVNDQEVKLTGNTVKKYLTRGNGDVTDQEVAMFVNLCKFQKLNPFLNEAYLIKFGSSPAQSVVSKEAYMKKAERSQNFEGFEAGIIIERNGEVIEVDGSFSIEKDKLLGGWCKVYKKNRKFPYIAKVNLSEFQKKTDKKNTLWDNKPNTMIRKVAIVQALREAFPEDLGAMYIEEEGSNIEHQNENIPNSEEIDITDLEEIKDETKEEIIDVEVEEVTNEKEEQEGVPY